MLFSGTEPMRYRSWWIEDCCWTGIGFSGIWTWRLSLISFSLAVLAHLCVLGKWVRVAVLVEMASCVGAE